ncbi:MAG TPA: LuxR C-terminal-related transcriptional regulator [Dehalococcoidia bacterium]|nr:LuxR C-terminal-related transcriptional regulator [Dehalococcoidia bacterium]
MLAPEQLSERRKRILDGIVEGKSNPVLAEELGLTLDGIKWHVSEMLGELGLSTRQELAGWWREERRKSAPIVTPIGHVRAMLRWGTRVALAGVITGTAVFGIWCAATRKNAAPPPAASAGASALAFVTVDGAAEGDDPADAVSHLYIEAPGEEPRLVRDYPGQLMYEMLASRDGRYIAVTTGKMLILARDGRQLMDLGASAVSFSGAGPFASWSDDGRTFAFTRLNVSLAGVPTGTTDLATPPPAADPAKPQVWIEIVDVDQRRVITPDAISHAALQFPSWAPGGSKFAAMVRPDDASASDGKLVSVDARSGNTRQLVDGFGVPLWSPDGGKIAVWLGSDVPIIDNGTRRVLRSAIAIIPAGGGEPDHFYETSFLSGEAWSPDGSRLAAACLESREQTPQAATTHLCFVPADGEGEVETIAAAEDVLTPKFSSDGMSVAYLTQRDETTGLYTLEVFDLASRASRTVASGVSIGGFSWLPAVGG